MIESECAAAASNAVCVPRVPVCTAHRTRSPPAASTRRRPAATTSAISSSRSGIAFRRCAFAVAPRVPAPPALHSHPCPFVADVQLRHSLYAFAVSTISPDAVAQCRLATDPSRLWCRSTDSYLTCQNYDFRCMLCCHPLLTALVAPHLTTLPLPLDLQTTFRRVSARSARSARRWRTTCRSSRSCKKKGALPRPCVVVPFCTSLC